MDYSQNKNDRGRPGDPNMNRGERNSSIPNDLPDSPRDREELKPEETFIDLPDVKDIPGQEFVHVPPLGELADTTISSDDEEGVGVFDVDDSGDFIMGTSADVTRDERQTLEKADYMPTRDEDNLQRASMDNTDFQGDELNEKGFGDDNSGHDLDIPGADADDRNENIGEEDEENNDYSLGSSDNDNVTEGIP